MGDDRYFIRLLRAQYKYIKEELHPSDKLVDALYQEKFISRKYRENILSLAKSDHSRAIDVCVKGLVHTLRSLDDRRYITREHQLIKLFKEYECEYLLNINGHNQETETSKDQTECLTRTTLPSSDLQRLFRSERTKKLLKDEIEPKLIIDDLLVNGTLSFDDHEDIFIKAWRIDRVEILLNYITQNLDEFGPLFLEAIRTVNPSLEQQLFQRADCIDDLCTDMRDITITLQHKYQEEISIKVPQQSDFDITLRFRFNGNKRELHSIERDIVSTSLNPELQIETMDYEASVDRVSFSSVVIHLKAYSTRALLLISKLLQKPNEFQNWMEKLLTSQQKQMLLSEGWDSLSVEVKTIPKTPYPVCNSILNKTVVENEVGYLLNQKIGGLKYFLQQLSSLTGILSDEQLDTIKALTVVENYIDLINGFLKLLVTLPQSCICRFEMFLKTSSQHHVLRYLHQKNISLDSGEVTEEDVSENITYLCKEIDPKQFYHILPDMELKRLLSILLSQGSRRERCRVFLKYILESKDCDLYIRKFIAALESLKLYNILRFLRSSKNAKNPERSRIYEQELKNKLLENKALIMNEVDVVMLRTTFVDRGILNEKQFYEISTQPSRKACVVKLLNLVFDQGYPALVCFIDALRISGYNFVAGTIENTPDQALPCLCFAEKTDFTTVSETEFSIQLTPCEDDENDSAVEADDFTSSGQTTEEDGDTLIPNSSDIKCETPSNNVIQYRRQQIHLLAGGSIKQNSGRIGTCEYIDEWLNKCRDAGIWFNQFDNDAFTFDEADNPDLKCDSNASVNMASSTDNYEQSLEIEEDAGKYIKRKRIVRERNYKNKGHIVFEYLNLGFTPRAKILSVREFIKQLITP